MTISYTVNWAVILFQYVFFTKRSTMKYTSPGNFAYEYVNPRCMKILQYYWLLWWCWHFFVAHKVQDQTFEWTDLQTIFWFKQICSFLKTNLRWAWSARYHAHWREMILCYYLSVNAKYFFEHDLKSLKLYMF